MTAIDASEDNGDKIYNMSHIGSETQATFTRAKGFKVYREARTGHRYHYISPQLGRRCNV